MFGLFKRGKKQTSTQQTVKSTSVIQYPDSEETRSVHTESTAQPVSSNKTASEYTSTPPEVAKTPTPPQHPTKKRKKTVTGRAKKFCTLLDIEITDGMSNADAWDAIKTAIRTPHYRRLYDEACEKERLDEERTDREEYGDELYDAYKYWESVHKECLNNERLFALVMKRGKNIVCDVAQFDIPDLVKQKKSYVLKLEIILPKVINEGDGWGHLDWDKFIQLIPRQILWHQRLPERESKVLLSLDSNESLKTYKSILGTLEKTAVNYQE